MTPCNSIDPTRLDPQEIERVRQAGSSKTVDPNALAKSLSKIHVRENGGQSSRSATEQESDAARVRRIEEFLRCSMQFMTSHYIIKDATQLVITVVNYHAQFSTRLHSPGQKQRTPAHHPLLTPTPPTPSPLPTYTTYPHPHTFTAPHVHNVPLTTSPLPHLHHSPCTHAP